MKRDARLTPANGRVAHAALQGQVAAERFTEGERRRVAWVVAPLHRAPGVLQPLERQLVLHEVFQVLEERGGWSFGFAARDGFVGYLPSDALGPDTEAMTHVVCARQSYLASSPDLRVPDEVEPISFGTELSVSATHEAGRWGEVGRLRSEPHPFKTCTTAFVPMAHLRALDRPESDPVAVAERFLGTPYRWGGNSGFGIDCSGLVQAALMACHIPCPGDSDLQEATLGEALADGVPSRRGDLIFWPGHVAMCLDEVRIIHATAAFMQVVIEEREAAIARIEAAGEGPLTSRRRIS